MQTLPFNTASMSNHALIQCETDPIAYLLFIKHRLLPVYCLSQHSAQCYKIVYNFKYQTTKNYSTGYQCCQILRTGNRPVL